MRLGIVLDQYPALSETFIADELRALAADGHELTVATGALADPPNPDAPALDVRLIAADGAGRRGLGDARELLAARRWRAEEPVRPFAELAATEARFRAAGVTHLHAHFAAGAALDALRLAHRLRVPWSVTAHAYDVFQHPRNLREKLEDAAVVFTGCASNVDDLRRVAPGADVRELIVGLDPERFTAQSPPPGGRTVLAVGRLVPKKGFGTLIEAAEYVPGVTVRIVGDGPLRADLERAADGRPVELLGARPPAEVRALLEEADVLAAPCVIAADGDRDSMPVVVKEAMAMERLVAASDLVGLPECVRPPWGRLHRPGDAHALAATLRELLDLTPAQRHRAGHAGRDWVLERADARTQARRMAAALQATAGRTPPRR